MIPPKPAARPDKVSLWRYLRLFRADLLSAQPQRLYRAWMAEFRTPFFRSYLCNDPALVRLILTERPEDFPKSRRIREGLTPLLGNSVFVTNGDEWRRQRSLVDPAFEGGRLRDIFPAMREAVDAAVARMPEGAVEVEEQMSLATADIIFRTLFSIPIDHHVAAEVFRLFRDHQRSQPILNLAALLLLPAWMPRPRLRRTTDTARRIRRLIAGLVEERAAAIAGGSAPDDLATKIMTARDPETGRGFTTAEMVDQVAIFFLAGHETSASALSWALLLLALAPDVQERVWAEVSGLPETPGLADLSRLRLTRDVFRETLRLYPPVPMMVRETTKAEVLRGRISPLAAQLVLSPWHLHRHKRLWDDPDAFDPDRWQTEAGRAAAQQAYIPFSAGPRVCPGAGFATIEATLMLARLTRVFRFAPVSGPPPVPVAHLTVRARDGIRINVSRR